MSRPETTGHDYCRADVVAALRAVGVRPGDVVFSHTGIAMLGRPAEGLSKEAVFALFLAAFQEALGPDGTWILPAFTYSYARGEVFDPEASIPRSMGLLPELLCRTPGAVRSLDPIFSVVALGGRAAELAGDVSADCFGDDSIWGRLYACDAAICNIGIGSHATFIHHVEQRLGVPYRFPKTFRGTTIVAGVPRETEVVYNVRPLDDPRCAPYFMRLDRDGRLDGSVRAVPVGRGEINLVRARRMAELIHAGLEQDPEYLVMGDLAARSPQLR